MGAIAHLILLVIFFVLAGHELAHAFKLPPASKLLLILAVVAALAGIVLATRRHRRTPRARGLGGPHLPARHWLPVIPGWAAWRLLQRRDYL